MHVRLIADALNGGCVWLIADAPGGTYVHTYVRTYVRTYIGTQRSINFRAIPRPSIALSHSGMFLISKYWPEGPVRAVFSNASFMILNSSSVHSSALQGRKLRMSSKSYVLAEPPWKRAKSTTKLVRNCVIHSAPNAAFFWLRLFVFLFFYVRRSF